MPTGNSQSGPPPLPGAVQTERTTETSGTEPVFPQPHGKATAPAPTKARIHWQTVAFGALPASYLAVPAGIGLLIGFVGMVQWNWRSVVVYATGLFWCAGTISLWIAARSRPTIGKRTAAGLMAGLIGAVLIVGVGLVERRPPVRLSLLSCVLLCGPVLISLMHLARFRKLMRTEPSALPIPTPRPPLSAKSTRRIGVALKALLFGQLFAFCLFGATMQSGSAGLGGLGIMVMAIPFALGVAAFSAWAFVRDRPSRPWAAAVFVAPIILSMLLQLGVKLVGQPAVTAACARVLPWLPLAAILFFPHVVGRLIPGPLRRRVACIAYVVIHGLMLLVWGLLLLSYKVSPEMGKGLILVSAPLYGAISIVAGVTGLLFGYVGLFQPRGERQIGLSIAHMVLSTLLLAIAVPTTWFLATLMTPPG